MITNSLASKCIFFREFIKWGKSYAVSDFKYTASDSNFFMFEAHSVQGKQL